MSHSYWAGRLALISKYCFPFRVQGSNHAISSPVVMGRFILWLNNPEFSHDALWEENKLFFRSATMCAYKLVNSLPKANGWMLGTLKFFGTCWEHWMDSYCHVRKNFLYQQSSSQTFRKENNSGYNIHLEIDIYKIE